MLSIVASFIEIPPLSRDIVAYKIGVNGRTDSQPDDRKTQCLCRSHLLFVKA